MYFFSIYKCLLQNKINYKIPQSRLIKSFSFSVSKGMKNHGFAKFLNITIRLGKALCELGILVR